MKKTIIGITFLIAATLADVGITISASLLASGVNGSNNFWTAVTENGFIFPFFLSKALFVFALIILIKEYFSNIKK